jgi:hypothetical protein
MNHGWNTYLNEAFKATDAAQPEIAFKGIKI